MGVEIKGVGWHNVGWQPLNLGHVEYPWHKWLNGSVWMLVPGRDFDLEIRKFQQYAHEYAARWGIKIRTKQNEARTALFFQAYKASSGQGDRRRRHFRRLERTWMEQHEDVSRWDYVPSDFLQDGKWDGSQWVNDIGADSPTPEEEAGAVWATTEDPTDDRGDDDGNRERTGAEDDDSSIESP